MKIDAGYFTWRGNVGFSSVGISDPGKPVIEVFNPLTGVSKIFVRMSATNVNVRTAVYETRARDTDLIIVYRIAKPPIVEAGKLVCFTGKLDTMTWSRAIQAAEGRGLIAQFDVTNATDIAVVGSKPGSKLRKIIDFDVRVMTEEEFFSP